MSQQMPKTASRPAGARRWAWNGFFLTGPRGNQPANTLILTTSPRVVRQPASTAQASLFVVLSMATPTNEHRWAI